MMSTEPMVSADPVLPIETPLFAEGVHLLMSRLDRSADTLFPSERAQIARAVPKRQREFATGRWCARRLLTGFGFPAQPLLAGSDRAPRWPTGAVGSISHSGSLCGVAVAYRDCWSAVGLDVEDRTPLDEHLWHLVVRPDEVDWVRAPGWLDPGTKAKLLFSAKECLYKCQYPLVGLPLEFTDVHIDVDEGSGQFCARIDRADVTDRRHLDDRLVGRFALANAAIVTGMAWPA